MFEKLKEKFKKKKGPAEDDLKKVEDAINEGGESGDSQGDESQEQTPEPTHKSSRGSGGSSAEIIKLTTEIDRMKASIESFGEVRKSLQERISNMNEQIGELRAMIMDRDRTIQELELKAVKAADLVETVQPEKLMIEIQREDAKFEALKANMEGNEAIMDRVMEEMRELRKKMEFFRGIEEIVKLSEETKKELIEIKRTEGSIKINADKVGTIYSEMRKKGRELDMFNDSLQELKVSMDNNVKDVDSMKIKLSNLADKSELEKLTNKVQKYTESLKELNKSSALSKDLGQLKKMLESL